MDSKDQRKNITSNILPKDVLVGILKENFVELSGAAINQTEVFDILHLDKSKKILATNAMKEAFSGVLVSRKRKDNITLYKNVARKSSLNLNPPSLSLQESSEIKNIKEVIASVSAELELVNQHLEKELSDDNINRDAVRTLVDMLFVRIQELSNIRENVYEKEIQQLLQHQKECERLCANDKKKLNEEMQTFIGFLNIGLETSLDQINFDSIFNDLPSNVRERCPILYDVLDTLFLNKSSARNVSEIRYLHPNISR
ncbi:uncharacterized protein LOC114524217 [Dendronephthya gigantea]|uniref:uncharacterized protein LOC114524217 n=1 Tax=Dendronephthya gigantea TaxID=151771 RepID=UPI00106BC1AC|nr:uncharacterized protein LOC114524217 [Dendronephthya gigantea]